MLKYHSIIILLLILTPAAKSKIKINDITSNKIFIQYTDLAVYMTKRFVNPKTSTIVITEKCSVICNLKQNYHTELLNNIIGRLYDEFAMQLFMGHHNDQLWDYNIFIVDSFKAFISLRYTIPFTRYERFFNFFILLTWSANSAAERYETLIEIFKTCRSFNVRNVVVMSKPFDGQHISFFTYELFNKANCHDKISIREINRYENGTLQNEFLFPDYINNFHGCHLNVSAHVMEPLLNFKGDFHNETQLAEINRLSGVEGDILKILAKALNFKISLRFSNEKNVINLLSESTGCFRDLENKRAHIALGGFSSTKNNSDKFSRSNVYHTTPFVFIVQSGLCFGPIKQLLNPFCPSTWLLLLIILIISIIAIKIIQTNPVMNDLIFGLKNNMPISSMFVVFLGNALPTKILPKKKFARFLLAAWLLLSFEVRNGYQGKMFDSLRFSKRMPVPKTIAQLLEQDYTLLSPSYSDLYPRNKTELIHNITERRNMLQTSSRRLTTTAFLDSLAHFNFMNYKTSTLTYVEEVIHTIPCVMYFQKHSIFLRGIDRKLKKLTDAGITSYVAKQHVRSKFQNMNSKSQYEIKLTNTNLKGLYFLSGVMFLISIIVFVLELMIPKSNKLRKIMDGLNSF